MRSLAEENRSTTSPNTVNVELARRQYVETAPFLGTYNPTGEPNPEPITSVKIIEERGGYSVYGNNFGVNVFEGKRPGSAKIFRTPEAAAKAIEDAIKKYRK